MPIFSKRVRGILQRRLIEQLLDEAVEENRKDVAVQLQHAIGQEKLAFWELATAMLPYLNAILTGGSINWDDVFNSIRDLFDRKQIAMADITAFDELGDPLSDDPDDEPPDEPSPVLSPVDPPMPSDQEAVALEETHELPHEQPLLEPAEVQAAQETLQDLGLSPPAEPPVETPADPQDVTDEELKASGMTREEWDAATK